MKTLFRLLAPFSFFAVTVMGEEPSGRLHLEAGGKLRPPKVRPLNELVSELASDSTFIIDADIMKASPFSTIDSFWCHYDIRVHCRSAFRGTAPNGEFQVRILGHYFDSRIPATPPKKGERYVLFLHRDTADPTRFIGSSAWASAQLYSPELATIVRQVPQPK